MYKYCYNLNIEVNVFPFAGETRGYGSAGIALIWGNLANYDQRDWMMVIMVGGISANFQ